MPLPKHLEDAILDQLDAYQTSCPTEAACLTDEQIDVLEWFYSDAKDKKIHPVEATGEVRIRIKRDDPIKTKDGKTRYFDSQLFSPKEILEVCSVLLSFCHDNINHDVVLFLIQAAEVSQSFADSLANNKAIQEGLESIIARPVVTELGEIIKDQVKLLFSNLEVASAPGSLEQGGYGLGRSYTGVASIFCGKFLAGQGVGDRPPSATGGESSSEDELQYKMNY